MTKQEMEKLQKEFGKDLRLCQTVTVQGEEYKIYRNASQTKKYAVNSKGESKIIYNGGAHFYKDLETRKRVAIAFGLKSFRK